MDGHAARLAVLQRRMPDLADDLRVLGRLIDEDHASALNKMRFVTEKLLHRLAREHTVSWGQGEPTLERMIGPLLAAKVVPKNVGVHIRTVQTNASPGSHFQEDALSDAHVQVALLALLEFCDWAAPAEPARDEGTREPAAASPDMLRPPRALRISIAAGLAGALAMAAFLVHRSGPQPVGAVELEPTSPPAASAAEPALTSPAVGLAALEAYRTPTGDKLADLGSALHWDNAARDFEEAAKQEGAPVRWQAATHFCRGRAHLLRGKHEDARAEMELAISKDDKWPVARTGLAGALSALGRVDEAVRSAQDAQRLEPEWPRAVSAAAHALTAARRFEDAITEYRRALTLAKDNPLLTSELALTYHAAGLDLEADRAARQALAQDENAFVARILLAERALEKNDGKTALAEAERAVATEPRSMAAQLARADALALDKKRKGEAKDAYVRLLELDETLGCGDANESRIAVVKEAMAKDKLPPPRAQGSTGAVRVRSHMAKSRSYAVPAAKNSAESRSYHPPAPASPAPLPPESSRTHKIDESHADF